MPAKTTRSTRSTRATIPAATRAREAQRRLADIRRSEPIAVPKVVLSVTIALWALLPGYSKEVDDIAISQIMELSGEESERDVYKALGWLRDNLIIERPRTKGGRNKGGATKFLSDAEVEALLLQRHRDHVAMMEEHGPSALAARDETAFERLVATNGAR